MCDVNVEPRPAGKVTRNWIDDGQEFSFAAATAGGNYYDGSNEHIHELF